jgi:hypothetical protein
MRKFSVPKVCFKSAVLFFALTFFPGALWAQTKPVPATADQIASKPGEYYGKRVAARGRVLRLFGRQAFTLETGARDFRNDVLVIIPEPVSGALLQGDLTVTGPLRPFDKQGFSNTYRWFDSNLPAFRELANLDQSPVIIAEKIQDKSGKVVWEAIPSANGVDSKKPSK